MQQEELEEHLKKKKTVKKDDRRNWKGTLQKKKMWKKMTEENRGCKQQGNSRKIKGITSNS